jgi:hypothetical protein
MDNDEIHQLRQAKRKIDFAISHGRSERWSLTLWSRFIRLRDAHRCVMCRSPVATQIPPPVATSKSPT